MAQNDETQAAVSLFRHERRTPIYLCSGSRENWKDPESGEWLRTCTIITGEPNGLVAQIHPRMPVILPQATSRDLVRLAKACCEMVVIFSP
jgi:putative SOS response-associated peptidase YedK